MNRSRSDPPDWGPGALIDALVDREALSMKEAGELLGGVELGLTNTGGERKLVVDSITVTNAIVANINVADGDVTINNFTANGAHAIAHLFLKAIHHREHHN